MVHGARVTASTRIQTKAGLVLGPLNFGLRRMDGCGWSWLVYRKSSAGFHRKEELEENSSMCSTSSSSVISWEPGLEPGLVT